MRRIGESFFCLATVAAIALAHPANARPQWTETVRPDSAATKSDPNVNQNQRLLDTHNGERAKVGVAPLVWDATLEKSAAVWAKKLAETNSFEHDTVKDQGENLWTGTSGAYQPEEMVNAWIEERKDFKPGKFPNVTKTAAWQDVGHYTQLIWKDTKKVGCAKAKQGELDVLVCRYSPPGNWDGVFVSNDLSQNQTKIAKDSEPTSAPN